MKTMTEPLDLDALTRSHEGLSDLKLDLHEKCLANERALIAELEATRSERDEYHDSDLRTTTLLFRERERAERAETEKDEAQSNWGTAHLKLQAERQESEHWSGRAERAEAAVARVEALCDDAEWGSCIPKPDIRDALRGDA